MYYGLQGTGRWVFGYANVGRGTVRVDVCLTVVEGDDVAGDIAGAGKIDRERAGVGDGGGPGGSTSLKYSR